MRDFMDWVEYDAPRWVSYFISLVFILLFSAWIFVSLLEIATYNTPIIIISPLVFGLYKVYKMYQNKRNDQ